MTVRFYGKGNPVDQCPAVFVDFASNRIFFQGDTVTDPVMLAEITAHSPMLPTESVVALPPHMAAIIADGFGQKRATLSIRDGSSTYCSA